MNPETTSLNQEKNSASYDYEYIDVEGNKIGSTHLELSEELDYQLSNRQTIKCRKLLGLVFTNNERQSTDVCEVTGIQETEKPILVLITEEESVPSQYVHSDKTVIAHQPETTTAFTMLLHRLAEAKMAQTNPIVKNIYDLEVTHFHSPTEISPQSYQDYQRKLNAIKEIIPELISQEDEENITVFSRLASQFTEAESKYSTAASNKSKADQEWNDLNYSLAEIIKTKITGERRKIYDKWQAAQDQWLKASEAMHEARGRITSHLTHVGDSTLSELRNKAHRHTQQRSARQVGDWLNHLGEDSATKIKHSVMASYRSELLKEHLASIKQRHDHTFDVMLQYIATDTKRYIDFANNGIFEKEPIRTRLFGRPKKT